MDDLLIERNIMAEVISSITAKIPSVAIGVVPMYIKDLEDLLPTLQENNGNINRACPKKDRTSNTREFTRLRDLAYTALSELRDLLPDPVTAPSTSNTAPVAVIPAPRLPEMTVPTFHGDGAEWPAFSQRFSNMVNKFPHLNDEDKLHYLLGALQGKARNVVSSITPGNGTTFAQAWQILESRYQNMRHTVYRTARKIFQYPTCQTPQEIESLIDSTRQALATFQLMQLDPTKADFLLLPMLLDKIPPLYTEAFEATHKADELKNIAEFLNFLQARVQSHLYLGKAVAVKQLNQPTFQRPESRTTATRCDFCNRSHRNFYCPDFSKEGDVQRRWNMVLKAGVCTNCLSPGHHSSECTRRACKKCNKWHHTLLHRVEDHEKANFVNNINNCNMVLLGTAMVSVRHREGHYIPLRAVVDGGATSTLMTENARQRLGLPGKPASIRVEGIEGKQSSAARSVQITIASTCTNFETALEVLVLTKVASKCPPFDLEGDWSEVADLQLADPEFHKSGPVDLLLGQDIIHEFTLPEQRRHKGCPMATNSQLGWVLQGPVRNQRGPATSTVLNVTRTEDGQPDLSRFWELEEVPRKVHFTPEEERVEQHFTSTTEVLPSGRYRVRLPLSTRTRELGSSRHLAITRQLSLEKKFVKNIDYQQMYIKTVNSYITEGYLYNVNTRNGVYLPHHGVVTKGGEKLRVVFDASATTSTGLSLNSVMELGPKTQPDLFSILLRFRLHTVALTMDIEKMYMQILVHEDDRAYQKIVWRENLKQDFQDYEFAVVTWGTKAAPFLATRVLKDIGERVVHNSILSNVILNDFYVDDGLTGSSTVESARLLITQLQGVLGEAGFKLHKWASNCPQALEGVEPSLLPEVPIGPVETNALGMVWVTDVDLFKFRPPTFRTVSKITKRLILSETGKVFDPMGWVTPIMLSAKILIQDLWRDNKYTWDTPLPEATKQRWQCLTAQFVTLDEITIPRRVVMLHPVSLVLCGFADASEKAFAAVIFLRSQYSDGSVHVALLASKTKLAPTKPTTLPRLELCGAVLLARLMVSVKNSLNMLDHLVYAFTDSTVALGWISSHPSRWKTFISNRVGEIQSRIPANLWRHCRSEENPADIATRGATVRELKESNLWWYGPPLLATTDFNRCTPVQIEPLPEERPSLVLVAQPITQPQILTKFSRSLRCFRVTAYVLRFISKCRQRSHKSDEPVMNGALQFHEITKARQLVLCMDQKYYFAKEISALTNNKLVHKDSVLYRYSPFIDQNGLLRIGGRLRYSDLPPNQTHPIVMSRKSHMSHILIRDLHLEHAHTGPHLLITIVHRNYFIPGCRNLVRKLCRVCVSCARMKARTQTQLMADLPRARVTPSPPFTHCGVDLGGPYTLRTHLARSTRHFKAYIALFVCFSTRALHLELLSNLSAECFLAAFTRFTSRRTTPSVMYSDQGTNFTAASKALQHIQENRSVLDYVTNHNIEWKFNPPSSPHWGGLWEAGIKSAKYHIAHLIRNQVLNFEEMSTVLCKVEAVLNSRPLTEVNDDSLEALTPAHLLNGGPLIGLPEPPLVDERLMPRQRWQLVTQLTQHFWKRWSAEYLTRLQQRPKWCSPQPSIKMGQLVLIKDDNLPPLKWKLGRVTKLIKSPDDAVRAVVLKTLTGELTRPIVKISVLPLDDFRVPDDNVPSRSQRQASSSPSPSSEPRREDPRVDNPRPLRSPRRD